MVIKLSLVRDGHDDCVRLSLRADKPSSGLTGLQALLLGQLALDVASMGVNSAEQIGGDRWILDVDVPRGWVEQLISKIRTLGFDVEIG